MKHTDKKQEEVVSFVAEAMLEPCLIAWYQARQTHIDALTLNKYLEELSYLVLEKNWAHKIHDVIISSKQGDHLFINWKIEMENLNAILTTSSPTHVLTEDGLKIQLEALCLPAAAAIHSKIEACDDETDSYMDHPFTVPHLIATLDTFGHNISEFPLPFHAMLDIGCPSVVISSALANELGLR